MPGYLRIPTHISHSYDFWLDEEITKHSAHLPLNTYNTKGVPLEEFSTPWISGFSWFTHDLRAVGRFTADIPFGTTGSIDVETQVKIDIATKDLENPKTVRMQDDIFNIQESGTYECVVEELDQFGQPIPCKNQIWSGVFLSKIYQPGFASQDVISAVSKRDLQAINFYHDTVVKASNPEHGVVHVIVDLHGLFRNYYHVRDDKLFADFIYRTASDFSKIVDGFRLFANSEKAIQVELSKFFGNTAAQKFVFFGQCERTLLSNYFKGQMDELVEALGPLSQEGSPWTRLSFIIDKFGAAATWMQIAAYCYKNDPPDQNYKTHFDVSNLFHELPDVPVFGDPLMNELILELEREMKAAYAFARALDAFERIQGAEQSGDSGYVFSQTENYTNILQIVQGLAQESAAFFDQRFDKIIDSFGASLQVNRQELSHVSETLTASGAVAAVAAGRKDGEFSEAERAFVTQKVQDFKGFVANGGFAIESFSSSAKNLWEAVEDYAETNAEAVFEKEIFRRYEEKFGSFANSDNFWVAENDIVQANVLLNDYFGKPPLKIKKVDGKPGQIDEEFVLESGATLKMSLTGEFVYQTQAAFDYLSLGEQVVEEFTYSVTDFDGNEDSGFVRVYVKGANDSPVARHDYYVTVGGGEALKIDVGVLKNDTDPEGHALTAKLLTDAAHGNLALNGDGSFTYRPHADFVGIDSFTYVANDCDLDSNIATVSITVDGTPEPPAKVTIGNAPERFSRLETNAWRDAWTGERFDFDQKQELDDPAWTPVDLGTLKPGTFGGSSLWRGDLGVSGRTADTEPVPQEIDGTEALQVELLDFAASNLVVELAGFSADEGGTGIHEAARLLFLDAGDAVLEEAYVDAGQGSSFTFDDLEAVAAIVFQAGAQDADGNFAAGALSNGATLTDDAGSGFLVDRLEVEGQDLLIA